jgi:hypothetical protein
VGQDFSDRHRDDRCAAHKIRTKESVRGGGIGEDEIAGEQRRKNSIFCPFVPVQRELEK